MHLSLNILETLIFRQEKAVLVSTQDMQTIYLCLLQVEEAHELSQRIVTYLEEAGGQADSQSVIQHFAPSLSAAKAPLFKQLLQQVARLRRDASSGKTWVLRPDFVTDR